MKRFTRSTLLALAIAAPMSALAQDDATATDASQPPGGMDNRDNRDGRMTAGMMPMMDMMMQCMNMMESMHGDDMMSGGTSGGAFGGIGHGMGSGFMTHRMMGQANGTRYDAAAAEALAQAYLTGQAPGDAQDVEILTTALDEGRYAVTYRRGSTEDVVLIDAATGAIVPENQQ